MQRKTVAKAIKITSVIISFTLACQAVRFCLGDIGVPLFDSLFKAAMVISDSPGSFDSLLLRWFQKGCYYLGGFLAWLGMAGVVAMVGTQAARIAEVGFEQNRIEAANKSEE